MPLHDAVFAPSFTLIVAPLECFIMQGEHALPLPVIEKFSKTGGQLAKNVFLLRGYRDPVVQCVSNHISDKSGLMTTAHGLRIACLGGIYDANLYSASNSIHVRPYGSLNPLEWLTVSLQGFTSPFFTSLTVEKLLANTMTKSASDSAATNSSYGSLAAIKASASSSQAVDILLTNSFPTHITAFSSAPLPASIFPPPSITADPLADVVRRIQPRYHFVSGGGSQSSPMFWEREPFVWDRENGRVTRFLSLGAFGGTSTVGKKQRVCFHMLVSDIYPC